MQSTASTVQYKDRRSQKRVPLYFRQFFPVLWHSPAWSRPLLDTIRRSSRPMWRVGRSPWPTHSPVDPESDSVPCRSWGCYSAPVSTCSTKTHLLIQQEEFKTIRKYKKSQAHLVGEAFQVLLAVEEEHFAGRFGTDDRTSPAETFCDLRPAKKREREEWNWIHGRLVNQNW